MSRSVLASVIWTLDRKVRKNGQVRYISARASPRPSSRAAARPLPTPYQPGRMIPRLGPAEDPRDGAQVVQPARAAGSLRGPRADVELAQLVDRGRGDEERHERRVADERRGRPSARLGDEVHRLVPVREHARAPAATCGAGSTPRARRPARPRGCSRPSSGRVYLSDSTSPCSVILIGPSRLPYGWDRIASPVGPPPRPTEPPRPWNSRRTTPCSRATSRSARWARWICHWDAAMPASLEQSE